MQKERALAGAEFLRSKLNVGKEPIGLVLGTGWGDKLMLSESREISFAEVPGFTKLPDLPGHARKYVVGLSGEREVVALSGRIHLNEDPGNAEIYKMVRLQTEILMQLGVKKLIVTCAAGCLPGGNALMNELVVIDGFVTLFAPQMPLWAGEFCSPEDTLTKRAREVALDYGICKSFPGKVTLGGYAMVLGPFFEGRMYDKQALANTGASIVGMSTLPEACIAALYPGVEVLALAFVTNGYIGTHSHEGNLAQAKLYSDGLGKYLTQVIQKI